MDNRLTDMSIEIRHLSESIENKLKISTSNVMTFKNFSKKHNLNLPIKTKNDFITLTDQIKNDVVIQTDFVSIIYLYYFN